MARAGIGSRLAAGVRAWPRDVWVVIGFAVVVRVLHLYGFFTGSPFADRLVSDAHVFESWAARIAAGDWVGPPALFVLPPLYPYAVGLVYTVIGRSPDAVVVIQSLLGVISSGLVWRLASRRFGSVAGVAAGLLFASTGTVLFYESMLVGTTLAVFLAILALTFLDSVSAGRGCSLALAGLCVGGLALVRPNAVLLIPALAAWLALSRDRFKGKDWLRSAAVFAACAALPLLVLTVRNGAVAGEWTPLSSHGGINFWMGNHAGAPGWFAPPEGMAARITPEGPEGNLEGPRRVAEAETGRRMTDREVSRYWLGKGLAFWADQPVEAFGVLARKVRLFLSAYEVPLNYSYAYHRRFSSALNLPWGQSWVLYPLCAVGIWAAVRRRKRVGDWAVFALGYAATVVAFHVSARYRMPVMPVVACFGGYAVQAVVEAVREERAAEAVQVGTAAVLLATVWTAERTAWDETRDRSMDPYNLGTSYLYAGEPDRAVPYLEQASRAARGDAGIHYNLGLAYASVRRPEDAVRAYQTAVAAAPGLAPAHTNLGNLLFQSGQYADAGDAYRRALAADPASLNARAALGWVHFTYHRNDSARVAWEHVLSENPNHASAVAGMQRLRDLR